MQKDTFPIPLTDTTHTVHLSVLPPMTAVFCRLLALSLVRKRTLPENLRVQKGQLRLPGFLTDPARIHRYRQVCGFFPAPADSAIPPGYLQTLFIGLLGRYITSDFFPINPVGLIQTGQWFEALHPVTAGEPLDLSCTLQDMARTPKGIVTRFHLETHRKNTLVWQGISTYLTRVPAAPPSGKKDPARMLPTQLTIQVPRNTGRRYARVSGDYNPHHLFDTTARLIGFKQAMVHGMWSLSRTLAALEKPMAGVNAFSVDAAFKLPVFMPATLSLGYEHRVAGQGQHQIDFDLRDALDRRPHLKGRLAFPGRES